MERYQGSVQMDLIEILSDSGSPRSGIERAIKKVAEDAVGAPGKRGCLLSNSALELASHDAKVRHRVSESFNWLETAFEGAVVRASLGLYNERQDIDRLVEGLHRVSTMFRHDR